MPLGVSSLCGVPTSDAICWVCSGALGQLTWVEGIWSVITLGKKLIPRASRLTGIVALQSVHQHMGQALAWIKGERGQPRRRDN